MAKKNRKPSSDHQTVIGGKGAELLGLDEPFAAAPYRPGKHSLHCFKGDGFTAQVFSATYAAKKFLDILLQDDTIALTRGITGAEDTIVSSTGIKVRCEEIQEIINHEYSDTEEEWDLGEPYSTMAMRFRDRSDRVAEPRDENTETKPGRVKREKVEKAPKPSKEGLVSIGEIAAELKMEPRDARAILRNKKIPKPGIGWAWGKEEVDEIKKIIHDNK